MNNALPVHVVEDSFLIAAWLGEALVAAGLTGPGGLKGNFRSPTAFGS